MQDVPPQVPNPPSPESRVPSILEGLRPVESDVGASAVLTYTQIVRVYAQDTVVTGDRA